MTTAQAGGAHAPTGFSAPLDWREVAIPPALLARMEPGTRGYRATAIDGHTLGCFVSPPDRDGWHLSISCTSPLIDPVTGRGTLTRYPTWDEIRDARYRFCPDSVTMAMLLPPQREYVNVHATTFHLHQIAA